MRTHIHRRVFLMLALAALSLRSDGNPVQDLCLQVRTDLPCYYLTESVPITILVTNRGEKTSVFDCDVAKNGWPSGFLMEVHDLGKDRLVPWSGRTNRNGMSISG